MSGMYERALAQQRLDARRQRFRERQRLLLAILAVTTVVFFAVFVRHGRDAEQLSFKVQSGHGTQAKGEAVVVRSLAEGDVGRDRAGEIAVGHGGDPAGHMLLERLARFDLMAGDTNVHGGTLS